MVRRFEGAALFLRATCGVACNYRSVSAKKIRLFNKVNVQLGHQALSILSPREVTTYEGP